MEARALISYIFSEADEKKLIIGFWPWILTIQLTLEKYGETLKGKHIYLKLMKVEKMLADQISLFITE